MNNIAKQSAERPDGPHGARKRRFGWANFAGVVTACLLAAGLDLAGFVGYSAQSLSLNLAELGRHQQ